MKDTPNAVTGSGRARSAWWAAAFVSPLLILAAAALQPKFSFNRWDNFEYFTPVISEAHGQWLDGRVPYMNPHQQMGDPLLANAMPGVLYFPYTLAVFFMRLLGLRLEALPLIVVVLHLPFLAVGWFALLRRMGVRPWLAGAASVSACSGGFLWVVSSVWIFMVAVGTWLPWMLWGAAAAMEEPHRVRGGIVLAVALAALACLGHPQMLVYAWCFLALWAPLHAWWGLGRVKALTALLVPLGAAVLLSLPALLPVAEIFPYAIRNAALPKDEWMQRSTAPAALLGALLPLYRIENGCLGLGASLLLHQGAWLVPALALGGGAAWSLRGKHAFPNAQSGPGAVRLRGAFLAALVSGGVFLLLAMGRHAGLYGLTHSLPVWSSFRWPFKLLVNANAGLLLAAALGLELAAGFGAASRWRIAAGPVLAALAGVALFAAPTPYLAEPAALVCLAAGLGAMLLAPWTDRLPLWIIFLALVVLEACGTGMLCHRIEELKTYREPYGTYGAEELGLEPGYRVLPLSRMDLPEKDGPTAMQAYGLFDSATVNGYESATGTVTALAPTWYLGVLPVSVYGLLPPDAAKRLVGSDLLRSFNVRYLIVDKDRAEDLALARQSDRFRLHRTTERTLVFEDDGALPRAYFASHVAGHPEDDPSALGPGLLLGQAPPRTAYVAGGEKQGPVPVPQGRLLSADWEAARVRLETVAPEGGFLVVSQCYFPQWHAYVDGVETKVWRVNATLQGIELPAGAKDVVLDYRSSGLRIGGWGALAGLVLLAGWIILRRRRGASA